jgi:hypothetical protein
MTWILEVLETVIVTSIKYHMLIYVLDQHFSHHFFLSIQSVAKLKAEGIGTVTGKLYIGTAESIPPSELIDTTGAGDAFIGAVIYGNATTLFYFSLMCLSQRFLFQIYMMY